MNKEELIKRLEEIEEDVGRKCGCDRCIWASEDLLELIDELKGQSKKKENEINKR